MLTIRCHSLWAISKYADVDDYEQKVIRHTQEALYVAQHSIERAQLNQATNYDNNKNAKDAEFNVGDHVCLYTLQVKQGISSKLAHTLDWSIPLIRKLSAVNVELEESLSRKTIVHVSRCKLFKDH